MMVSPNGFILDLLKNQIFQILTSMMDTMFLHQESNGMMS